MKDCDNSTRKIHISNNFMLSISLLIMFDTLLLRPSLHCNTPLHFITLHPTTLHYTSPHFSTLHYTSPNYTSLNFATLHPTTLRYTSLHFTQLHFATLHTSPNYTSLRFTQLHFTTIHPTTLHYNSPNYTSLHFATLHTSPNYTSKPPCSEQSRYMSAPFVLEYDINLSFFLLYSAIYYACVLLWNDSTWLWI